MHCILKDGIPFFQSVPSETVPLEGYSRLLTQTVYPMNLFLHLTGKWVPGQTPCCVGFSAYGLSHSSSAG